MVDSRCGALRTTVVAKLMSCRSATATAMAKICSAASARGFCSCSSLQDFLLHHWRAYPPSCKSSRLRYTLRVRRRQPIVHLHSPFSQLARTTCSQVGMRQCTLHAGFLNTPCSHSLLLLYAFLSGFLILEGETLSCSRNIMRLQFEHGLLY